MRLPHNLTESLFFQFADVQSVIAAVQSSVDHAELVQISFLAEQRLPPVTSPEVLAVLIGVNPGLVWSLLNRHGRYYRTFTIRSGSKVRTIHAPKVALKIIQKWLSYHLSRRFVVPDHVFGFVPNKSHLAAAERHIGADWAYSVDIADFFSSTPFEMIVEAYLSFGYDLHAAPMLARLSCFGGTLAQGAPTSPTLSNVCFQEKDRGLVEIANALNCSVTRYADDIVFSGAGAMPETLPKRISDLFETGPWRLAAHKNLVQPLKGRIKIHGLLVKPDQLRLTKGYRNKIRAYSHVLATKGLSARDYRRLVGHVQYAEFVARKTHSPSGVSDNSADWSARQFDATSAGATERRIAAEAEARPSKSHAGPFDIVKRWFGRSETT